MELNFTSGSSESIGDVELNNTSEYVSTYIQFNNNVVLAGGENINMGVVLTDINGELFTEYTLKGYSYNIYKKYDLERDGNALNLPVFAISTIKFQETPYLTGNNITISGFTFTSNGGTFNSITLTTDREIQYDSTLAYNGTSWVNGYQTIEITGIEDLTNLEYL